MPVRRALTHEAELFQLVSLFEHGLSEVCRPFLGALVGSLAAADVTFSKFWTAKEIVDIGKKEHDRVYALLSETIGEQVADRCFEQAFYELAESHKDSDVPFEVLSTLPDHMLVHERARRLREIEIVADRTSKQLATINARLSTQTRELSDRVKDLREANETMRRNDAARADFIRIVSHQFRTPLSAIRWDVDAVEDRLTAMKAPKEVFQMTGEVRYEAKFLINALDKIFEALAIDTGSLSLDLKPTFFWELVQDVVEESRAALKAKGLELTFKKSRNALVQIPLDRQKMKFAIAILLENAINYSRPEGKIDISLSVKGGEERGKMVFEMHDDGIGVKSSEIDRVFDKFFRGAGAVKAVANGTGLGMYIVKSFVEAHGGEAFAASPSDGGFVVSLTLPT